MKIYDYKNLNLFLTVLFNFFKENGLISSIEPVEDYDRLLERILDCEFNYISYYAGMYCTDFKLSKRIEEGEVYYLIFGSEKDSASLLIDLGERELSSFFNFTWNNEKHPPYLKDFTDENGEIKIESEVPGNDAEILKDEDIMTFDDFDIFLKLNKEQKQLTFIEVE